MPAATMNSSEDRECNVPYREGMSASTLETPIIDALRTVFDPEIPVSVFDLGLIYDIRIGEDGVVKIVMTLTAPGCPVAEEIPKWVQEAVAQVPGVKQVHIELVWEPFWKPEYMTEAARLVAGLM